MATWTVRAAAEEDSSDEEHDAPHSVSTREASLCIERRLCIFSLQVGIGSCPKLHSKSASIVFVEFWRNVGNRQNWRRVGMSLELGSSSSLR